MRRVGILIPEFPGQTHSFFWRELAKLRDEGVEGVLISTRRPPPGLVCHDWTSEAIKRTHYLVPPTTSSTIGALSSAVRRPSKLRACVNGILRAQDMAPKERVRLAALALAGAALADLSRKENFSHVHVHSAADAAHVAMFSHLLGGPSYSMTLHGPLSDYGKNQAAKWSNAKFGVVITQKLLGELKHELGDMLPPTLEVAPMGVQVENYVRTSAYEPYSGKGTLRVFSCGRLNPVKGHLELAQAIGQLRAGGLDVEVYIAGEDDAGGSGYRLELERLLAEQNLVPYVHLLGAISENKVKAELERAHLFALGSHHEPLGVAIMEAMALCLPVVVTAAGGVAELVTSGVDGLLVPAKDPASLAEKIREVALTPELAQRLGKRARTTIEQRFDSGISARLIAKYSAA